MKKLICKTFATTALLLLCAPSSGNALDTGDTAPSLKLPVLGTSTQKSLKDLRGKIVYLDFWATWCTSCKISLPWLNELQTKYPKDTFEIVAVAVDKKPEKVSKYLKKSGLDNLTVLSDPKAVSAKAYKLKSFPFSLLINKEGKVIKTFKGFNEGHKKEITDLLGEHIS